MRWAPYLLIIPVVIFVALSLSGCVSTSPAIPSLYIVSLTPSSFNKNISSTPGQQLEVRIGYFGICGDDGNDQRCTTSNSVDVITSTLFPGPSTNGTSNQQVVPSLEIRDLVATARELQKHIFNSVLAVGGFLFLVGLVFLFLLRRDVSKGPNPEKAGRSKVYHHGTYIFLYFGTTLILTAALATTQMAGALQFASEATDSVTILMEAGTAIQVLQWMAFGFAAMFSALVPFLVKGAAEKANAAGEEYYKEEV